MFLYWPYPGHIPVWRSRLSQPVYCTKNHNARQEKNANLLFSPTLLWLPFQHHRTQAPLENPNSATSICEAQRGGESVLLLTGQAKQEEDSLKQLRFTFYFSRNVRPSPGLMRYGLLPSHSTFILERYQVAPLSLLP